MGEGVVDLPAAKCFVPAIVGMAWSALNHEWSCVTGGLPYAQVFSVTKGFQTFCLAAQWSCSLRAPET